MLQMSSSMKKQSSQIRSSSRQEVSFGSFSKSVSFHQVAICRKVRPKLYEQLGIHWPFKYEPKTDNFHLLSEKSLIEYSDYEFEKITMSVGPCIQTDENTKPIVILQKFRQKTTQGKVALAKMDIDGADVVIIVKANQITPNQKILWLGDKKTLNLKTLRGSYQIISKSYMDSLCCVMLSRLVEKNYSPHFPLCYASSANLVGFKRNRSEDFPSGSLCQTIWMEFLPQSMFEVLQKESNVKLWWSAMFQVAAGLQAAQTKYGMVHNDLHSENIRVRKVPKNTVLYYEIDGNILQVETFGYVFVIIDFGRAFFKPWNDKEILISSEFGPGGFCRYLTCDNPSFDLVRLVTSLQDAITVIVPETDRLELLQFFQRICVTENGYDIIKELNSATKENLYMIIEDIPRKNCHCSTPSEILKLMINRYKIETKPENMVPFKL